MIAPAEIEAALRDFVTRDGGLTLHLYTTEPGEEPANYAPAKLAAVAWDISDGEARYPPVKLRFSGPAGEVRGYYLARGREVAGSEEFDDPYHVRGDGDTIEAKVVVRWRG